MIPYVAAYMAALHALRTGEWQVVTRPSRDPAGRPTWVTAATVRSHPRSTLTADARRQGESLTRCCETAGLRQTATLLRRWLAKVLMLLAPTPAREVAS
jgi:hypothetical protein